MEWDFDAWKYLLCNCNPVLGEYVGSCLILVADSKRLLGRPFNDPEVQHDLKHWPFTVLNDGGTPKYEIVRNGLTEMVAPEEVMHTFKKQTGFLFQLRGDIIC